MKKSLGDKIIDWIIVLFMLLVVVAMLYPLWNTLAISFNDARDSIKGGIYLWPREWTLYNYQSIFKTDKIFKAFMVSVSRTVLTTVLNVFFSGLLGCIEPQGIYFPQVFDCIHGNDHVHKRGIDSQYFCTAV